MVPTRRHLLASTGTLGIASLAGCSAVDFVLGNDSLSFEAARAVVNEATLSESPYAESKQTSDTITRTFEAAGQSREVEVTNKIAEYDRGISILGQEYRWAMFTVLSTPKVEILGEAFNPVADMSTDELIALIQDRYDQIGNVERDSTRSVEVLGESVEVVRYRAEGRFTEADVRLDLTLHITEPVAVAEDFVVCFGVHPRQIDDTDEINQLLGGVEHTA
ncbi:hypothetical protein EGH24_03205 [Halonotius terrestris]|uniref:Uncharacterized protein n=1 Tax=Halonotius terrestris TaxID=2487750 RepID=A0A8J8TDS1_9EURY|nr:DUF6517 family protein [Halonotius terrestris]TQQ83801.1 hypothetical protein EGH24_03205 [Halonotius terrestris]